MTVIQRLFSPALLAVALLLSACANPSAFPSAANTPASLGTQALPTLVPFASDEGLARLARSHAKAGFAALVNQYEAQYNGAFCGPTSATIVLNTVYSRTDKLARDPTKLHAGDLAFLPAGANPVIPRFTQDSVIDKGPKTRAQVLGEPVTLNGKPVQDFGYQLHQLGALLRANGLATTVVVVDAARTEQAIRADLSAAVAQSSSYVLVNYTRDAIGQKGGGHISPLGAYDAASDSLLVLDVNPAVAGWVWMPTATLVKGMRTFDTVENRGYVVVRAP